MDGEAATLVCTNDACKYSETGQCVEGNALDECPHLQNAADPDASISSNSDTLANSASSTEERLFRIGGGKTLSVPEASSLLKTAPAPIVSFLGQVEAGKTSLIAEVYDAFQYGNYTTLKFAGSLTLLAFEQICHKVRASSEATDQSQTRTDLTDDPIFYHLSLRGADCGLSEILIADRSGETYAELMDTPQRASECLELTRATVLNLLVDGARLCETAERAIVKTESVHLIQALVLSNTLPQKVRINIVLTKLDCVDKSPHGARAHSDFESIVEQVREQTRDRVNAIETFKIAARPQNELYRKGYGVEALIQNWITPTSVTIPYLPTPMPAMRSFDRLRSSLEVT